MTNNVVLVPQMFWELQNSNNKSRREAVRRQHTCSKIHHNPEGPVQNKTRDNKERKTEDPMFLCEHW
jgi:hypothetical protein